MRRVIAYCINSQSVRNHQIELSPANTISNINSCNHSLVAEFSNLDQKSDRNTISNINTCKHSLVAEFSNLDQTLFYCQKSPNRAKPETNTISNINTCNHSLVAEFSNLDKPETHYLKYQHIQAQFGCRIF